MDNIEEIKNEANQPELPNKGSTITRITSYFKKNPFYPLVLIPLLIIITLFTLERIYYLAFNTYTISTYKKTIEQNKKNADESYQELLERQAKENATPSSQKKEQPVRQALNSQTVNIILVKPTTLPEKNINALTTLLQSQNGNQNTSLNFIKTFLEQEAAKYSTNLKVTVKIYGLYSLSHIEKVGDIAYIWSKDPFGPAKLEDGFVNLIKTQKVSLDKSSVSLFLYFDESFDTAGSEERFYEYKKFRSFANQNTGNAFVNIYDLAPGFATTTVEIATHELLHLYGATDKYEESESVKRICSERGRGDINKKPPVPQYTADIMCMYVEKEKDQFERGSFSKQNLVINQLTAKEIGWDK